jgi:hypothetical protein
MDIINDARSERLQYAFASGGYQKIQHINEDPAPFLYTS